MTTGDTRLPPEQQDGPDPVDVVAAHSPDDDASTLVDDLLACPTGLAFLLVADAADAVGSVARDHGAALCLAAEAVAGTPEHGRDLPDARLHAEAGRLRHVAEELVTAADGVPRGWSSPFDAARQRWAGSGAPAGHGRGRDLPHDRATTAAARGGGWEAHLQQPSRWVVTDGEVLDAGGRARGGVDEWDAHGLWDVAVPATRQVLRWRVATPVAVAEVDRPGDWEALVERFPGPVTASSGRALDWVALADEIDGVHLTLRGLLTARRLPPTAPDAPRLWAWRSTGTRWARPVGLEALPPGPALPVVAHRLRWPPLVPPQDPAFEEGDEIDGSELDAD